MKVVIPARAAHCSREMKALVAQLCLFETPWTTTHQAPPSMGFFRPEYWSGLPFLSPGDLHEPGIKLGSPALQADSLPSESQGRSIAQGRGFHPQEEGIFGHGCEGSCEVTCL